MSLVSFFFGTRCWLGCARGGCTLAPPGEYEWAVHMRRRCGLVSNYFDHLLLLGFTDKRSDSRHADGHERRDESIIDSPAR